MASLVATVCLALMLTAITVASVSGGQGIWCVARSNASDQELQAALDYACGSGADCLPIQKDGLCFLPNTVQAHASYAFNSFYQRKGRAPGSCDFTGHATYATTDPSYGSCVYPSSPSGSGGKGGSPFTSPPMNEPTTTTPTPINGGGDNNPGELSPAGISTPSTAPSQAIYFTLFLVSFSSLLILSIVS